MEFFRDKSNGASHITTPDPCRINLLRNSLAYHRVERCRPTTRHNNRPLGIFQFFREDGVEFRLTRTSMLSDNIDGMDLVFVGLQPDFHPTRQQIMDTFRSSHCGRRHHRKSRMRTWRRIRRGRSTGRMDGRQTRVV